MNGEAGTRLSAARIEAAAASLKAELDGSLVAPGRIHLFWQTIAAHALAAADVVEASECYLREDDAVSDHDLSEGVVCARCYGALADTISAEASEVARLRERIDILDSQNERLRASVSEIKQDRMEVARLRTALDAAAESLRDAAEFASFLSYGAKSKVFANAAALAESVPSPEKAE